MRCDKRDAKENGDTIQVVHTESLGLLQICAKPLDGQTRRSGRAVCTSQLRHSFRLPVRVGCVNARSAKYGERSLVWGSGWVHKRAGIATNQAKPRPPAGTTTGTNHQHEPRHFVTFG